MEICNTLQVLQGVISYTLQGRPGFLSFVLSSVNEGEWCAFQATAGTEVCPLLSLILTRYS